MPTYKDAPGEVYRLALEVMSDEYPQLFKLDPKLRLKILFAYPTGKGHALTNGGYPAAGLIKIVNLEGRAAGGPDVIMKIDATRWTHYNPRRQRGLISHELYHLIPDCQYSAEIDAYQCEVDSCGRPVFEMRKHDWQIGGFLEIAARYGDDSIERAAVEEVSQMLRQLPLPFIPVPATEDEMSVLETRRLAAEGMAQARADRAAMEAEAEAEGAQAAADIFAADAAKPKAKKSKPRAKAKAV